MLAYRLLAGSSGPAGPADTHAAGTGSIPNGRRRQHSQYSEPDQQLRVKQARDADSVRFHHIDQVCPAVRLS